MYKQVMMYNSWRDGMDVSVKHLVPQKLPPFVLQKASEAQQAAKAITQAAEVRSLRCSHSVVLFPACGSLPLAAIGLNVLPALSASSVGLWTIQQWCVLSCQARAQHSAVQAGDKPKEVHKRTLELEGSAEALGPAQKKRIVEGGAPSAAVAASARAEPAHEHPGQQNGLAGPHAGSAAAVQPNGREHSASAAASSSPAQPQARLASAAEMRAKEAGGAAGLGSADVKAEDQHTGPAGPHSMPAKQEALSGAVKQEAQTSWDTTPELCIDRIDGKTGQVSHCSAPRCDCGILSLYLVKLCAELDLVNPTLTSCMIRAWDIMHVGVLNFQMTAAGGRECSMCTRRHHDIEGALDCTSGCGHAEWLCSEAGIQSRAGG